MLWTWWNFLLLLILIQIYLIMALMLLLLLRSILISKIITDIYLLILVNIDVYLNQYLIIILFTTSSSIRICSMFRISTIILFLTSFIKSRWSLDMNLINRLLHDIFCGLVHIYHDIMLLRSLISILLISKGIVWLMISMSRRLWTIWLIFRWSPSIFNFVLRFSVILFLLSLESISFWSFIFLISILP